MFSSNILRPVLATGWVVTFAAFGADKGCD